jgi:hypothetical protein
MENFYYLIKYKYIILQDILTLTVTYRPVYYDFQIALENVLESLKNPSVCPYRYEILFQSSQRIT